MSTILFSISLILLSIALVFTVKNRTWLLFFICLSTLSGVSLFLIESVQLFTHALSLIITGISSFLLLSLFYKENSRLKWCRVFLLFLALLPFLFKWSNLAGASLLLWNFIPCTLLFIFLFLERRKIDEQAFYELALCFLILGFFSLG